MVGPFGWWSTRLADVDGDSNPDVILPGFRNIRVLFDDGRGNFTRSDQRQIVAGMGEGDIVVAMGTLIRGDVYPRPRVFQGVAEIAALFDGSQIYARLSAAPYSKEPIETLLALTPDGSYSGTADVLTSCCWKVMTITAKAD